MYTVAKYTLSMYTSALYKKDVNKTSEHFLMGKNYIVC